MNHTLPRILPLDWRVNGVVEVCAGMVWYGGRGL